MLSQLILALAAASVSSAHFILHWPPTAGFDDDAEATSPCGGATVSVNDSSPKIQVDQFAVMIQSTHPTGEWMFRGTTNTEAPWNFTDIVPIVNTSGIGDFCLTAMSVPSEWAGQAGVIQVIDNSVDGELYQCAPVNFVMGSNSTTGSACTNATGFEATWTTQKDFTSSDNGSDSSTASASTSASSSTSSAGAAMVTGMGGLAGLGLLAAGLAL